MHPVLYCFSPVIEIVVENYVIYFAITDDTKKTCGTEMQLISPFGKKTHRNERPQVV